MKIGLIDPALYTTTRHSPNIGDLVISRACRRELESMFGEGTEFVAVPSHEYPSRASLRRLEDCEHIFVGGSNLLWFRWWRPSSWKIGPLGLLHYRDLVLLGVGWGAYDIAADAYGKWVCKTILSGDRIHSVRDGLTRNIVSRDLAVPKVLNTACPTMWCLTPEKLGSIHTDKGDECIFSLTDYSKNPQLDGQLLGDLTENYGGRLLFWPQGDGDLEYCRSLGYSGRVIDRSLPSLLKLLASGTKFDYVGTRLHAGILCLEHGVRSLIIAIDNRAKEISVDTGLPGVGREDRNGLLQWLTGDTRTDIRLPAEDIAQWKRQFMVERSGVTA